jgi:hypothetical protein
MSSESKVLGGARTST